MPVITVPRKTTRSLEKLFLGSLWGAPVVPEVQARIEFPIGARELVLPVLAAFASDRFTVFSEPTGGNLLHLFEHQLLRVMPGDTIRYTITWLH
jgi:hypothetical protein